MNASPYTGVFPIAPTPFNEDGTLDLDGMRRVLDCMIAQGVDGICILANFSEQFALTDDEREILLTLSLEHIDGRVPVIATASHFCTDIAVARAKRAEEVGAAMLMMMPPYHGALLKADDQGVFEFAQGLSSIHSGMIRPVQEDWVIGISGAEIPWLGTVKLMVSGGDSPGVSQVPGLSFVFLIAFVGIILAAPAVIEPMVNRILRNSPEAIEAERENAIAMIYSSEEE